MARPTPVDVIAATLGRSVDQNDSSARHLGSQLLLPASTVKTLLDRWQPVADTLRSLRRDHLLGTWQWAHFVAMDGMAWLAAHPATTRQEHSVSSTAMRNYAVVASIATEKALLVAGQPTAIIAGVVEHRLQLPALAARLAEVAAALPRRVASSSSGTALGTTESGALPPHHDVE